MRIRSSLSSGSRLHDDRQAADELGDQAVLQQIVGGELAQQVRAVVAGRCASEPKPMPRLAPTRLPTMLLEALERATADEQDVGVLIWMKSWCGCLRPPCGGTLATVPSMIFSSACWTPSPETSRVIDGLSPLRAILSISSM